MSSYRQALKTCQDDHIRKLIDNKQNNPRFLFSTVARLTNKQMSPDLNIPSQCNSNDFKNFFTDKITSSVQFSYKIFLLTYKALNGLAPVYLTNLLLRYNPTHSLRLQNSGLLIVPRIAKSTKRGSTFSYLTLEFLNSLPDNVRVSDTLSLFKSRLKTHLFCQAFI